MPPVSKISGTAGIDSILVRGARVHNLKNIDVEIPHNWLTVITGVSGSGKSSLAFDTIYAEGQRRYVESLSAYARQFLERIEKPDVDQIDGIAPAIAIRQKNTTRNPRSTVATVTEVYDYLRLLFARIGRTFCIQCGREVRRDTVDEVAAAVLGLPEGTRLQVLFPVRPISTTGTREASDNVRQKKKAPRKGTIAKDADTAISEATKARLFDLRQRGFNRLYQSGNIFEFSTPESLLEIDFSKPLFALVDRLAISAESRARIVDGMEIAFRESGEVVFETVPREDQERRRLRFSQAFECKNCHTRHQDPEPRLFSFNNPYGACPRCQGFGNTIDFDPDLVVPDRSKTLAEGAIEPWTKPKYRTFLAEMKRIAKTEGIPLDVPWCDLTPQHRSRLMEGDGKLVGIKGFFDLLERKKYKLHVRVFVSRYRGYATCPECRGSRLRAEAQSIRIEGLNICEVCAFSIESALKFFLALRLTPEEAEIAETILQEIISRLKFLQDVGLEYLTLDRLSSTLSGGEAQRIQLATSLGSRLVGALYVLDEPSIGLHSRDTAKLIRILHELRNLGNTILVVEHDIDMMRAADHIVDLGPGAGEHGGQLIASGSYEQLSQDPRSLTGRYLRGHLAIPTPQNRRIPTKAAIRLHGARAHNLKTIDVDIPLRMLVAITGVSGSGKSTLVHDVLYKALSTEGGKAAPGSCALLYDSIEGAAYISDVVLVDQSPIGRTPRSNPITYMKAFDAIRELFAAQPEAQKRSYASGHFSFNVPGGRCEVCQGDGTVTVEMQFLADVELVCEECKGTRYKASVLEVRYKGKNIFEVLNLTVREALHFFSGIPKIVDKLRVLEEVGLGYLRLGQSATTLSGGEAQRMKLAAHLTVKSPGRGKIAGSANGGKPTNRILYIFDEPTTGLHFDDVGKLLAAFRRLIDAGGSLVVIEHNLDVIKAADWVIDLGPEGGAQGGDIVAIGTPEQIAAKPGSHTGHWLAKVLTATNVALP